MQKQHFIDIVINIQESGERTISSKPSPADEAIEVLVNAYKSSNTSENAKKEMHDINETVSVIRYLICLNFAWICYLREMRYDIIWLANPGRSDDQKKPSQFCDKGVCTHQKIVCEHVQRRRILLAASWHLYFH